MDNHGMDDHDMDIKRLDDPKWKLLLENPKVRLAAALAVGLALGSGATWATLSKDAPKNAKISNAELRDSAGKPKNAACHGPLKAVKQSTAGKKKPPVPVAKKNTKKPVVTSASAKKKSTAKPATTKAKSATSTKTATSKTKPATKTTTTAKSTKKKKRSTTAKPANASTKPATTKPATSTSNTSALKPPVVDSKCAQPVTTADSSASERRARIHTMVPE
jgi:hypothetical protein